MSETTDTTAPAEATETTAKTQPTETTTADTEVTSEATEQAATEATPVEYVLTLPEGSPLDPAVLERTAADARTQGLTNEQAQAVVNRISQEAAVLAEAQMAAYQPGGAEYGKLVDGWKAQTLADESLGKTPEERTATIQRGHQVLQKYVEAHPDQQDAINGFLNDTGLGNHPAMVKVFAWLGRAMSETPVVKGPPASASGEKNAAKALYPNMN